MFQLTARHVVLEWPACKGARGGDTPRRRYTHAELAAWGRKGGRPKLRKLKAKGAKPGKRKPAKKKKPVQRGLRKKASR